MYQQSIKKNLKQMGREEVDPRHVEAWMRLGHSTLDGLPADRFALEVDVAVKCIDAAGTRDAERLAASYNL